MLNHRLRFKDAVVERSRNHRNSLQVKASLRGAGVVAVGDLTKDWGAVAVEVMTKGKYLF